VISLTKVGTQCGFPSVPHSYSAAHRRAYITGQTFAVAAAHNTVSLIKRRGGSVRRMPSLLNTHMKETDIRLARHHGNFMLQVSYTK